MSPVAAVVLAQVGEPVEVELPEPAVRRRVELPSRLSHPWVRVWSEAELLVEVVDAADGTPAGPLAVKVPPATAVDVYAGRGELAVSETAPMQRAQLVVRTEPRRA